MSYESYFKETRCYTNAHNFPVKVRAGDDEISVMKFFSYGMAYPDAVRMKVNELTFDKDETYKDYFQTLEQKNIPIDKIIPTQKFVYKKCLDKKWESPQGDLLPEFICFRGMYYLLDGHHRVCHLISLGKKKIKGVVEYV